MRLSKYFVPTLKEVPNDAVVVSHILMLRSGMVRMLSAGIYSFLPLGYRVVKKSVKLSEKKWMQLVDRSFIFRH